MNSRIMPPPPSPPKSFISFTFENGIQIKSYNKETVQALVELFESTPDLDKKNAYFIVDNQVIFMKNIDFVKWHLVEEEKA
jgi:hypothetical protein